MINNKLRCSPTSFTLPVGSLEYFSSVGFIFRSSFVSLPHIFQWRQDVVFYLHLFQIRMGPVPFNGRSMVDEFGLCRSVAPDPFPLCILGSTFISASFRPRLMGHIPASYFLWPDTILLFQPFSEPEPDVAVEFVEGFRRIDRPVVGGPPSNDRIGGLYLVSVVVVGRTSCGHGLDRGLAPASRLFQWGA